MKLFFAIGIIAHAALVACTPSNVTPPPDATDATPPPPIPDDAGPEELCEHLRALGCAEGTNAACDVTMANVLANPNVMPLDIRCTVNAQTKSAVRTCAPPHVITCP